MRLKRYQWIYFTLVVVILSGCGKNGANEDIVSSKQDTQNTTIYSINNEEVDETDETGDEIPGDGIALSSMMDVPIYSLDVDTKEIISTVVSVPDQTKITPSFIVDLVLADLEAKAYQIIVDSVEQKNDVIIVNINESTPLLLEAEKTIESSILDVIAQTLLDNILDCRGIVFQVNHEGYESSNFSYDRNYVYLNR